MKKETVDEIVGRALRGEPYVPTGGGDDAPAQPAAPQGGAYAELPPRRRAFLCTKCGGRDCEPETLGQVNPPCKCGYLGFAEDLDFTADDLRDFADRTHALRASHGQAPAGGTDPDGEAFRAAAHLGLTLRFYGGCAQSSMPGTPSAYEVVAGGDRAAAMREAVQRAAAVIENGGESQRLDTTAQAAPAAGAVAGPWKDHQTREIVNQLRDCAKEFHATQQLRERLLDVLGPMIDWVRAVQAPTPAAPADSVLEDAAQESEYRRGYRRGYEQRDAEVRGALA